MKKQSSETLQNAGDWKTMSPPRSEPVVLSFDCSIIGFCHGNCIWHRCSLFSSFSLLSKKQQRKKQNTKKAGTLTEQLKAGRLEQDCSEMHQQQHVQGPGVDKASPPVVDSRRTRTRRCDGHLPSFHAWKQSCPFMWRSGQEIFHLASTHGDGKGCHFYWQDQTLVCAFFTNPAEYMKMMNPLPSEHFSRSPCREVRSWLAYFRANTHGWAGECEQAWGLPWLPVSLHHNSGRNLNLVSCVYANVWAPASVFLHLRSW